jgi:hypothetical protein
VSGSAKLPCRSVLGQRVRCDAPLEEPQDTGKRRGPARFKGPYGPPKPLATRKGLAVQCNAAAGGSDSVLSSKS